MLINLDFLKFHNFKLNKTIHNLSIKEQKKYFEKLFFDQKHQSLFNVLKKAKSIENYVELSKVTTHIHKIEDESKKTLMKIIFHEHKNLYFELSQLFVDFSKIEFFQLKLINECRLIFVIYNQRKYSSEFIPILFDINHCLYTRKDKHFHKRNENKYSWDFRNKQNEIKQKLLINGTKKTLDSII